jgi:hypothetical protein
MKNLLSLSLVLTTATMAFAQGKLCFCNNIDNLLYLSPDHLGPADWNKVVGGFPLAGSSLYTGAGSTVASLAGAPSFTVALFAGATANSLSQVAAGALGNVDFGGLINPPVNVKLAGLPAGTPAFFQIQVFDSRFTSAAAAWAVPGQYAGVSPIFQATPQVSVYSPIYQRTPPVNSTWAPGTFVPVDYVGFPGYYGGIEIAACLDQGFWGFAAQPTNQTVVLGATATFYVRANSCPSPYYQWYFNGVSIPGAADSSLQISTVQPTNAGTYSVVLSNPAWHDYSGGTGTVSVSASATLTVLVKPTITFPPQSQTAEVGSSVWLYVNATNTLPLSYQWFFNGTLAITGSTTNCALLLTNVQPSQAGAYTVVVTNIAGAVTSSPAMLNVIAAVEHRPVPGVKVMGQTASMLNVDYANALSLAPNWNPLGSVSLTSTSQYYFDLTLPLPPQRYYQAWQTGTPVVIPSLDLHLVPAITLTGNLGNSVRLDCINQFGPTDAWVTLDTVTLTNTSQLYFDTSALGQPQRLYRLVQVP